MGVAVILGVAVIAYLAWTGQTATVNTTVSAELSGHAPVIGSYSSTQPSPLGTNPTQTSQFVGSSIDAGAAAGSNALASAAANGSQAAGAALPIVGAAVAIFNQLWAAHEARLKGATNENQAVPLVTPVFDQAITAIAQNWRATRNQTDAINALAALDQQIYQYLKGRVGAPGTAWVDNPHICDKACTVGCCIYWNDFRSAIFGDASGFNNGTSGMIPAIQAGGNRAVNIPKVYPSKYQTYSRSSYSVQL